MFYNIVKTMIIKAFFAFIIILIFIDEGLYADYHVDPVNGDDVTGDGLSYATAFQTLQRAEDELSNVAFNRPQATLWELHVKGL